MTASDQMRAMLDQLMGTQRDGEPNQSVKFSDDGVCKTFLLGCCPHEILTGTRADIGNCKKIHDLALKADYEMAAKSKDYFYDFDAYSDLKAFVAQTDNRIEMSKERLAEQQAEVSADVKAKEEAVHDLNEKIGKLIVKAEKLGSEGEVDQAKECMDEIEELKIQKKTAEDSYRNSMPASTYQQQKLRVCEICSAYLGLHDNDCRLADHFGGKLHAGFIEIRDQLAMLEKSVESRKGEYEIAMVRRQERMREDRVRMRERDNNRRLERDNGYHDRDSYRSQSHDWGHSPSHERRHSRSRERSERRRRSRSRERSRHRRDRSRSPRDHARRRSYRRSRSRS